MSTTTSAENTLVDRGRTALRAIIDGNLGQWIGGRAVTGAGDEISLISPSEGTVDRKSTRLNSSHPNPSRMPSSA